MKLLRSFMKIKLKKISEFTVSGHVWFLNAGTNLKMPSSARFLVGFEFKGLSKALA